MKKTKVKYNIINTIVILLAMGFFVYKNQMLHGLFEPSSTLFWILLIVVVMLIHVIKALRMYLALYDTDIGFVRYIKEYCKVTPVSVIVPFKLGEFFRMYCYGALAGNSLKGIIVVLLDRFMDTAALVTMVAIVWMMNHGQVISVVYLLVMFLVVVLVLYFVYPGVYKFWKKYLLKTNATNTKIAILKLLESVNSIYVELSNVVKGRGFILYFMSLVAWIIEMGGLCILVKMETKENVGKIISEYLMSAINGEQSFELQRFVFISVIFLVLVYMVMKIKELMERRTNV